MSKEFDVKRMVNRFLAWKLPADFNPDCGISFDANAVQKMNLRNHKYEPVGTNLFTAAQAEAMVRHMLESDSTKTTHSEDWEKEFDLKFRNRYFFPTEQNADSVKEFIRETRTAAYESGRTSALREALEVLPKVKKQPMHEEGAHYEMAQDEYRHETVQAIERLLDT